MRPWLLGRGCSPGIWDSSGPPMVSAAVYGRSHSWHFTRRSQGIHSPRVSSVAAAAAGGHRKPSWTSFSISSIAVSFILASLALAAGCVLYLYLFRSSSGRAGLVLSGFVGLSTAKDKDRCDVFEGSWVPAEAGYPLYNSSECPFAERGFNCLANGRKDTGYLKWKWKPRLCEVPTFDARFLLEKLQGKRIVFVGDSMSRTQWESLICMLMSGVDDPRARLHGMGPSGCDPHSGLTGWMISAGSGWIPMFWSSILGTGGHQESSSKCWWVIETWHAYYSCF